MCCFKNHSASDFVSDTISNTFPSGWRRLVHRVSGSGTSACSPLHAVAMKCLVTTHSSPIFSSEPCHPIETESRHTLLFYVQEVVLKVRFLKVLQDSCSMW